MSSSVRERLLGFQGPLEVRLCMDKGDAGMDNAIRFLG